LPSSTGPQEQVNEAALDAIKAEVKVLPLLFPFYKSRLLLPDCFKHVQSPLTFRGLFPSNLACRCNRIFGDGIYSGLAPAQGIEGRGDAKKAELAFRLLPVPRALDASCGLVIRVSESGLEEARSILEKAGLKPRNIYRKEGEDYVKV
jgi:hypothetical protein